MALSTRSARHLGRRPDVKTRLVDDLVRALRLDGISESEVGRICAALDDEVEAFRCRPLGDVGYPTCGSTRRTAGSARRDGSLAALIATDVAASGERRVLGPPAAAVVRLVGMILAEQQDGW